MSEYRLANAYLAIRRDAPYAANLALERRLAGNVARAAAEHPRIDVDPIVFVEFLAVRVALEDSANHLGDLYLACAVANHARGAAERLEECCISQIGNALARIDRSPTFVAEVEQRIREKMLVGTDGRPRIAEYRARGSLSAFIRVAAIRVALMEKRAIGRQRLDELDEPDAVVVGDPTTEIVRREYHGEFRSALRTALATLDRRERTALRLNYFEDLSIDQIGRHFHVHRATAARWIARAQERVRDTTRQLMQERLGVSDTEADSLLHDLHDLTHADALSSGMLAN